MAYGVDHRPETRQRAADAALAALQFGPGDLRVDSAALEVLASTGHWHSLAEQAERLLQRFPLDG